jgi:outer membrane lipoprotein-sorting protein
VKLGRRAFLVASTLALTVRADDGLDALLADIATARKSMRSLRADLEQKRTITLMATTIASKGRMTYLAPDRLRWELFPPDGVVYFVGPEGLAYRTSSSSASVPAQGANVGKALTDLRALVGGDLAALKDRYTLSGSRSDTEAKIEGVAKDPKASSVRAFTLVLDKTLTLPVRAKLTEGKSDAIDVTFTNAQANVDVDPKTMRP